MVSIGFADIGKSDVGFLQLALQVLGGGGSLGIDRVIDHHLKDEVGAALQIEPQMDAVQHRLLERVAAQAGRNTEDAVEKDQQHSDDDCSF